MELYKQKADPGEMGSAFKNPVKTTIDYFKA